MAERPFMSNRPLDWTRRKGDNLPTNVEPHHLKRLGSMGYRCESVTPVAESDISRIISGVIDPEKMSSVKAKSRVKKAVEKAGHKKIYVKVIDHRLTDERFFKKEMTDDLKFMYRLKHHPNVAQIYGYFRCDDIGTSYVISELTPGVHVNVFMAAKKYDDMVARDIFKQIINAVEFVHSFDIIHRDLTPSSIVVDEAAHVKIRDFGLAPKLTHLTPDLMYESTKRVYTAPEVIKSRYYESKKSDVYSMGIILYEMLTGRVPYSGIKSKILQQIHDRNPEFTPTMPSDAMSLIREMIHPDPKKRPTVVNCINNDWVKSKAVCRKLMSDSKSESASTGWRKKRHAKLTSASNGTGLYMHSHLSQMRNLTHGSDTDEPRVRPSTAASRASRQTSPSTPSGSPPSQQHETLQSPRVKILQSFPSPHPQPFTSFPSCSKPKKAEDKAVKGYASDKNIPKGKSSAPIDQTANALVNGGTSTEESPVSFMSSESLRLYNYASTESFVSRENEDDSAFGAYKEKMAAILDESAARESPELARPKAAHGYYNGKEVAIVPAAEEQEGSTSLPPPSPTMESADDDIVIPVGRKTSPRGQTAPATMETACTAGRMTPDYPATPQSLRYDLSRAVLLSETFLKNGKSEPSSSDQEVEIRNFQLAAQKLPKMSVEKTEEARDGFKQLKIRELHFPCEEGVGETPQQPKQTDSNEDDAKIKLSSQDSATKEENGKPKAHLACDEAKKSDETESDSIYYTASSCPSENSFDLCQERMIKPVTKSARPASKYNRKGSPIKGITRQQVSLLAEQEKSEIMMRFFSGLPEAEPVPEVEIIERPPKVQSRPSTRARKVKQVLEQETLPPVQGRAMMLVKPKSRCRSSAKEEPKQAAICSAANSKSSNLTDKSSHQLVSAVKIHQINGPQENAVSRRGFVGGKKKLPSPKLNKTNFKVTPQSPSASGTIGGNVVLGLTSGGVTKSYSSVKNLGSPEKLDMPMINAKQILPRPKTCPTRKSMNTVPRPVTRRESKYSVCNFWIP